MKAIAIAANGAQKAATETFTIDNTPEEISITVGDTEGAIEISGTANFKEYLGGNEGYVSIYLDGSRHGYKYYNSADTINWTYKDLVNREADAGRLSQGEHTLKAIAIAANGAQKAATETFTIDNTPKVKILSFVYHDTTGTFDIIGIVEFKEHIGGNEGTLRIDIKESTQSTWTYHGTKTYNITKVGWKYSDITGHELDQFVWSAREIEVKATATANNGAKAIEIKGAIIPDLGCAL